MSVNMRNSEISEIIILESRNIAKELKETSPKFELTRQHITSTVYTVDSKTYTHK
jgi:hypothetical protein